MTRFTTLIARLHGGLSELESWLVESFTTIEPSAVKDLQQILSTIPVTTLVDALVAKVPGFTPALASEVVELIVATISLEIDKNQTRVSSDTQQTVPTAIQANVADKATEELDVRPAAA